MANSLPIKFAFLIHPRNLDDVFRKYPFLKFFPEKFVNFFLRKSAPIIISKIDGLVSKKTGLRANGLLISVGMTAKEMLAHRDLAKIEVIQAVRLAKKMGAEIVGLGALTSPMVNGGKDLVGQYGIKVTNGNTLTVGMTMEGIRKALSLNSKDSQRLIFAVVGATGSTGSAISKLIARDNLADRLILIGRNTEKLTFLKKEIFNSFNLGVSISVSTTSLKDADVVIVATSASGAVISSDLLKKNAIVYDITQPRNTSEFIQKERPDVTVIDGALVKLPKGVGIDFDSGLPENVTFSCLSETMILAAENIPSDFSVGDVDIEKVDFIVSLANKYGIKIAPLMSWGKQILIK